MGGRLGAGMATVEGGAERRARDNRFLELNQKNLRVDMERAFKRECGPRPLLLFSLPLTLLYSLTLL